MNAGCMDTPGNVGTFMSGCQQTCSFAQCTTSGYAFCNLKDSIGCATAYSSCAAGQSNTTVCNCYGVYGDCMENIGCFQGNEADLFVDVCVNTGCTLSQCEGTTTGIISPTTGSNCNSPATQQCASSYSTCVNGNANAFCNCYAAYGTCLINAQCLLPSGVGAFVQACMNAGCTQAQCDVGPVTTGMIGGVSSGVDTCIDDCASLCGVKEVLSCSCFSNTGVESYECGEVTDGAMVLTVSAFLFIMMLFFM